jgi:hypothetical protein
VAVALDLRPLVAPELLWMGLAAVQAGVAHITEAVLEVLVIPHPQIHLKVIMAVRQLMRPPMLGLAGAEVLLRSAVQVQAPVAVMVEQERPLPLRVHR